MKKIFSFIGVLVVALLITGCGSNGSSTGFISCKSEVRGSNPETVTYEEFEVKDNKVVEYTKYNILDFSDEYLNKVPMQTIIEVYEEDSEIKVEKVDNNTLKTTVIEPRNFYNDVKSDNMIETIRASFEDNELSLYKYTCEIK